jgi:hypothetical protein
MTEPNTAADAQVNGQPAAQAQENAQSAAERPAADNKTLSDTEAALLKENMAMKKRLKAIEAQQTEAERKALEDQGKHKELAELATRKAETLAQKLIQAELVAKMPGLIKADLIKLCDTSSLKIGDDGNIDGIDEVVTAFKTANPEYFGAAAERPTVPGTPKPGSTTGAVGFKTYDEYLAAPYEERAAWAQKNPAAFKALADEAMKPKG